MYGWRAKIGLLVPSNNTVFEPDIHGMVYYAASEGIAIYSTRLYLTSEDISEDKHEEVLERLAKEVEQGVKELTSARVDVILYGCTAGSFFKGVKGDEDLIEQIERVGLIPATTPSTAMIMALARLKINKVSVATPYSRLMDERLKKFLEGNGIDVIDIDGLRQTTVSGLTQFPPRKIYQLVKNVDNIKSDGILIPCTNFPVIDLIDSLEHDLHKPVITANQALFWHALRILGINKTIEGFGGILKEL